MIPEKNLKTDVSSISLLAGMVIFISATLTLLAKGGSFILLFTHLLPGALYGFVLAFYETTLVKAWKKVIFIISSTLLYWVCVYQLHILQEDQIKFEPLRVIIYSSLGFVLLKFFYDIFFLKKIFFIYSLILPIMLGTVASLITASCFYFMSTNESTNQFLSGTLFIGAFTIFPIWQYLFGVNINWTQSAIRSKSEVT